MTTNNTRHSGGIKAISLLSGGLDSILATKLIIQQGIEVEALNFVTVFCTCTSKNSSCMASVSAARQLGVPLKVMNISREYLEVVKAPKHGYGSNMNPCIDCRIFIFKKAKEYMEAAGASFIVTGEVSGERPMSQRKDMLRHIEKEAGLDGMIVRPLTAGMLKPSIPEEKGWVDREKFLSIHGRSRKPQIQLAADLEIRDYPCPAGGCLLTDAGFAKRIKDLMGHSQLTLENVKLLKLGRHFRLGKDSKVIVGRNKQENERILENLSDGDMVFKTRRFPGPIGVVRGDHLTQEKIEAAAGIVARYSDAEGNLEVEVEYRRHPESETKLIRAERCQDDFLENIRI